ncbi:hypothetical protein [Paradevosia shaoguanensis]|uniref:hypothetical protein n=1 Tax=Paradevosia shaoguanensis TaxID=1335043 RepID=UPI001932063B|nr:hypothetical protein [Paradevosia shaoguanensis]
MLRTITLSVGFIAFLSLPAMAGEAADILRASLYEGPLTDGIAKLEPMAKAGDQEAEFSLGMLQLVSGVEHFAQALYRHGMAAPDVGPLGPALAFPIPPNPNPEKLDYEKVRAILAALVEDMDVAKATLASAGASGDYVVAVDPLRIRIDFDADGKTTEMESMSAILAHGLGISLPASQAPNVGDKNSRGNNSQEPEMTLGLDRADALWMAGYSQVLASHGDFLLAHDFSDLVNVAFHRFFPRAGLPMQDYSVGGTLFMEPSTDAAAADAIAAIHTLNWPVVEPDRLKRVLERLKAVTAFSRQNWQAILAETDDDHEFIPSPRQSPTIPGSAVSQDMVDAWLKTLDTADAMLDGKLLVPHWRFKQGFDLKAYFETAKRTDLVMILTGYGAIPFLKDGPVASAADFAEANRVFGENLLGYSFYFN